MNPINLTKAQVEAMYRITLTKYSASRWAYSTHNPQGGSFGMSSYKTQRHAFTQALRGIPAGTKVLVVCAVWEGEEYRTTKQFIHTKV